MSRALLRRRALSVTRLDLRLAERKRGVPESPSDVGDLKVGVEILLQGMVGRNLTKLVTFLVEANPRALAAGVVALGPGKSPLRSHGRVLGGWEDHDAANLLTEIRPEVLPIAGQQMGRSTIDRRQQDWQIFLWQTDASRQGEVFGLNQLHPAQQPSQPAPLHGGFKVSPGLLCGMAGR
jgi:hypothetical protein